MSTCGSCGSDIAAPAADCPVCGGTVEGSPSPPISEGLDAERWFLALEESPVFAFDEDDGAPVAPAPEIATTPDLSVAIQPTFEFHSAPASADPEAGSRGLSCWL